MIQEVMIGQKRARQAGHPPVLHEREASGRVKLITAEQQCRLLGGNLQDNMAWGARLHWGEEALLPAVRKHLGVLKHLGRLLPMKSRKMIADGMVISKVRYLIAVWGGTTDSNIRAIQTLVNDAARFVLQKSGRRDSTENLMTACGWLSVPEMITYHSLLLLWRVLRRKCPKVLADKLEMDDDCLIHTDKPGLLHTMNAFRWRTSVSWNSLSLELRHNSQLKSFKSGLKKWILEQRRLHLEPGDDAQ